MAVYTERWLPTPIQADKSILLGSWALMCFKVHQSFPLFFPLSTQVQRDFYYEGVKLQQTPPPYFYFIYFSLIIRNLPIIKVLCQFSPLLWSIASASRIKDKRTESQLLGERISVGNQVISIWRFFNQVLNNEFEAC